MRFRGLLVAVVVLAALSGGIYWSNKVKEAEADKPDPNAPPKILSIPEEEFQQIEILKNSDEPTVLRKADSGDWEMLGPKQWTVDQDAAGSLVSTLSSLDSGRLVEEKVPALAPFGLESPAMEVTITKNNGEVQKLLIGEESPAGGGYFAKLQDDPRVFTVASYNKTSIDKSPRDLRDKRLLTFDSEKLTRVELLAKGQSIEFGKNAQNDWQIIRPKPLRADGGQVEELIRRLKDAKMDTYASEEDDKKAPSAFRSGKRIAIAKVTDVSGTQQLEVRKDKDDNYYARSNVVEGTHKITSSVGEGLDKSLPDFRNKKLFDFGWSDPSKIEVRDGERQATYEKSDDKWMAGSKQMDSTTVQDLVSKLRDLSAIEFVDKGYTTPFFEATVTSEEGKRVETVLISKQDERYFAKRENEPSIYELEGSAVEELQKAAGDVKEPQPPEDDEEK